MATPHVAGLAALILSQNPSLSQTVVKQRIQTSSDDIDGPNPSFKGMLGAGRINAAKALGFPQASITYPATANYVSGQINILGSARSTNIGTYSLLIGSGNPATLYETIFQGNSEIKNGTLCSFDTRSKADGLFTLKLICQSKTPLTSETSVVFFIDNEPPTVAINSPTNNSTTGRLQSASAILSCHKLADTR